MRCQSSALVRLLIDPATMYSTALRQSAMNAATEFLIKPETPATRSHPSQLLSIDFRTGSGGRRQETNVGTMAPFRSSRAMRSNLIEVEKGNKVGLDELGINDLWVTLQMTVFALPGRYKPILLTARCPPLPSKALVSVPIWDTCGSGFCGTGIPKVGGHQQVAVLGWALMFLEGNGGLRPKRPAGRKTDQHYGMWVRGHAADRFECIRVSIAAGPRALM